MAALVEKLVKVIGRAFYSDESIIVLQALVREKFLKDDEMGSAVNLQTRQVRRILSELQRDHLVSIEVLNDKRIGGNSSMTYWYIDYKHFVDVVKYRLYKMSEVLKEREQLEIERQLYKYSNSSCEKEYTSLEAQRLIVAGQHEFCCGHCGEPLNECDNNERLQNTQLLQKKFQAQMNREENMHDGITEIIRRIGDYVSQGNALPTNLPSDNRALGIGGASIRGISSQNGKGGGGGNGGGRAGGNGGLDGQENAQSYLYPYGEESHEIVVDIAKDNPADEFMLQKKRKTEGEDSRPRKQGKTLPEFLRGSAISGHLAAKHEKLRLEEIEKKKILDRQIAEANLAEDQHKHSLNGFQDMSEEQRQEAFKQAYIAELARYANTTDEDLEEVEIELDKRGWNEEMTDGANESQESESDDIEWEWGDTATSSTFMSSSSSTLSTQNSCSKQVLVQGHQKPLSSLSQEDLCQMTNDEYLSFYNQCIL